MYKQVIIARKDLGMSPGKLAAQVSHASMAFLTKDIRQHSYVVPDFSEACTYRVDGSPVVYQNATLNQMAKEARERGDKFFRYKFVDDEVVSCEDTFHIESILSFSIDLWNEWICGAFTKVILEAKNRNQLEKACSIAENLGLVENTDYFMIRDNCHTELEPEDEDGRTLTCVGFRPMDSVVIDQIGRKFQLWK